MNASANHNTFGRIAWHTVAAVRIITNLPFEAPAQDFPVPPSAQLVAHSYHQASQAYVEALQTQWIDQTMKECIEFIGQSMPNGSFASASKPSSWYNDGSNASSRLNSPGIYG